MRFSSLASVYFVHVVIRSLIMIWNLKKQEIVPTITGL